MDTQETKIYIAALIAAGVLGIILIYFIITMIRQQRKTRVLHLEKIQAEITAQENERRRIASDLHDEIGPLLSAVKFKINSVDLVHEEDRKIINDTSQHLDETLDHIRKISFDLMPNTLVRKGLTQTIEEFIPRVELMVPIKIRFVHSGFGEIRDEIKINLYRMILEIINNTVKHAKAKNLSIVLTKRDNQIVLLASDDGIGFDLKKEDRLYQGLGLKNLQSRAEIMNGEFLIDAKKGRGVKYNIIIPLT